MRTYSSLWDRGYMAKGLVLHDSLMRHSSEEFTLHVLAMDRETAVLLWEMNLPQVKVLPVDNFETTLHLTPVKESRTYQEYMWTAASQLMEYLMPFGANELVYLDSDMMFFSDPKIVFDEIGERSIGITPHRLIPSKKYLEVNGKFNVGWVSIKNTAIGKKCLARWAAQVRARCSARIGCGDQAYLDEWPALYGNEVCQIENIGVNVAPWNLGNWKVTQRDGKVSIIETPESAPHLATYWQLVFYHFHEYKDAEHLTNYTLRHEDRAFIYKPYMIAMDEAQVRIDTTERILAERHEMAQLQAERA